MPKRKLSIIKDEASPNKIRRLNCENTYYYKNFLNAIFLTLFTSFVGKIGYDIFKSMNKQ